MAINGADGFRQRLPASDDFQIVEQFAFIGHHGGDGLAASIDTAAADANDQIAIFFFRQRHAGSMVAISGSPAHGKCRRVQCRSRREDWQQSPGALRVAAGHHQRAPAKCLCRGPISLSVPAPKMMPAAVANSKVKFIGRFAGLRSV